MSEHKSKKEHKKMEKKDLSTSHNPIKVLETIKGGEFEKIVNMKKVILLISLVSAIVLFVIAGVIATPNGANITAINTSTAPATTAGNQSAYAGNVTEMNIFGRSTTQAWQGYFGNVSGVLQLADSSSNVMYNWTMASAKGEIYAANRSSVTWTSIRCFNVSSNATQIDTAFGISATDVDRINQTFNQSGHAAFTTASTSFSAGQCNSTKIYGVNGAATFDEVLLADSPTHNLGSVVFASIINNDANGFDSKTHDFEMLVPENGHNGDTSPTTYFFFVELG